MQFHQEPTIYNIEHLHIYIFFISQEKEFTSKQMVQLMERDNSTYTKAISNALRMWWDGNVKDRI